MTLDQRGELGKRRAGDRESFARCFQRPFAPREPAAGGSPRSPLASGGREVDCGALAANRVSGRNVDRGHAVPVVGRAAPPPGGIDSRGGQQPPGRSAGQERAHPAQHGRERGLGTAGGRDSGLQRDASFISARPARCGQASVPGWRSEARPRNREDCRAIVRQVFRPRRKQAPQLNGRIGGIDTNGID